MVVQPEAHALDAHERPLLHTVPQLPQFRKSRVVSTQPPLVAQQVELPVQLETEQLGPPPTPDAPAKPAEPAEPSLPAVP